MSITPSNSSVTVTVPVAPEASTVTSWTLPENVRTAEVSSIRLQSTTVPAMSRLPSAVVSWKGPGTWSPASDVASSDCWSCAAASVVVVSSDSSSLHPAARTQAAAAISAMSLIPLVLVLSVLVPSVLVLSDLVLLVMVRLTLVMRCKVYLRWYWRSGPFYPTWRAGR